MNKKILLALLVSACAYGSNDAASAAAAGGALATVAAQALQAVDELRGQDIKDLHRFKRLFSKSVHLVKNIAWL